MAKLKNVIKQLSEQDVESIYKSLVESNAEKSAFLLKAMREKQVSDEKIMGELDVNPNAYYTLRSRLNQKIEEYLLEQMESPRADILKKVANINEIVFTKKKTLAVATLKKMEKELLDYDLSNELTIVYKSLKKLHLDTPDYFNYSQLYNRHVAYMLSLDKAEIMMGEYFSKFGEYFLSGNKLGKLELSLLVKELHSISKNHESHRLYVYYDCVLIFHRLFVEADSEVHSQIDEEPLEDIFSNVSKIFETYKLDSIYYHLNLVFEYLKFHYYTNFKVYRKAESYYEEINDSSESLFTNYAVYCFPSTFLIAKLERAIRFQNVDTLDEENKALFVDLDDDSMDPKNMIVYYTYRSLSAFYAEDYQRAATWLNDLLNKISFKKYQLAQLEVKTLLAMHYCMMKEYDLFNQLVNSIQRNIRLMGKENCENVFMFVKALKIAVSENKRDKHPKIKSIVEKLPNPNDGLFHPTLLVSFSEELIGKMSSYL